MSKGATFMGVAMAGLASAGSLIALQHCLSNGHDEDGTKLASSGFSFLK